MKSQKLSFKYLSHRILLIKSNVFSKIIITIDQSDSQCPIDSDKESICHQNQSKIQIDSFISTLDNVLLNESVRRAFGRIKLAGWKIILEAKEDEQEDSIHIFSSLESDQQKQNVPMNHQKVQKPLKKRFSCAQTCSHDDVPDLMTKRNLLYLSKVNSQTTRFQEKHSIFSHSRASAQYLKRKKREIIINKLLNAQRCIEYLSTSINHSILTKQRYLRY